MDKQNESVQTKKSFWTAVSPKMTFVFGLVFGIAVFATLSLLYSYLALSKINAPTNVPVNNEQAPTMPEPEEPAGTPVGSFIDTGKSICKKDGKPIIRLFSTTWCPHSTWIKETFEKVVADYVKKGKIVAYHWELDSGDDALTKAVENAVPAEEEAVYNEFNPRGSIPTLVFGCRYYRIGNAYEREGDVGKLKEEKEFKDLIEKILTEK